MRKYTFYFVCLLMLSVTVSCKKENKDNVLQARMTDFHTSKAYIDEQNYSCFRSGEEINVNNQNCSVTPNQQDNSRSCNISNVTQTSGYYAFYPSSLLESNADISDGFDNTDNVVLPQTQDFVYDNTLERQVINNPMAGHLEASSGTILLQNLCALLKVTVYSTSNSTLRSIDVTLKGTTIWGTGHVNDNDWSLVMEQQENHSTVTLSFGTNGRQGNPSGESFYIVVPKATIGTDNTNSVQVIIHGDYIASNLSVTTRTFQMGLSSNDNENVISKNTITPLPEFSIGCPVDYNSNCVFTVAPGKQVTIAERNLIQNKTSFACSCEGTPYTGGIDLTTNYYYFEYNNSLTGNDAVSDWGWVNSITYASGKVSPPHTWRTPTRDEWQYMLFTRSTTSNKRFAKACFGWHQGLIVFPDTWIYNENNARHKKLKDYFDGKNKAYPNWNQFPETDWTSFKNEGCVFLAAHGNSSSPDQSAQNGIGGYYATANGSEYCMKFSSSNVKTDESKSSNLGVNVRLVHDLP